MIAVLISTKLALGALMALLGVLLSGAYSGLEIGCYRLSEVRLRLEAERRGGPWQRLLELTRHRDRLICVILIGNSMADYLATGGLALLMTAAGLSAGKTELYATLVLAPTIFVLGEMIPKALFESRADTLTVRGVWLLEGSRRLFTYTGLVGAIGWLTRGVLWLLGRRGETADLFGPRDRIRAILLDQAASGVLSRVQIEVARNVLGARSLSTRLAMTPIDRVAMIDAAADRRRILEAASECRFSRLVVHKAGDRGHILGYLDIVDALLAGEAADPLADRLRPVVKLAGDRPVTASLLAMQEARCQLGVVYDSRDRAVGIVTWKDLVEELVGELTTDWRRIRRVMFD